MDSRLSKEERALLLAALNRGSKGRLNSEDVRLVMGWAEDARYNAELLRVVLAGLTDVVIDRKGSMHFVANEAGLASVEAPQLERLLS
jgi:hypothetical protein